MAGVLVDLRDWNTLCMTVEKQQELVGRLVAVIEDLQQRVERLEQHDR